MNSEHRNSTLTIESGGTFATALDMIIGYHATDREGTALVRDGGLLEIGRDLGLATWGTGTNITGRLLVHTGGVATVSGDLLLTDNTPSREAHVEITGAGAHLSASSAYLGGDDEAAYGDTYVSVAAGGLLELSGTLHAWDTAELTIDGGTIEAATLDLREDTLLRVRLHAYQVDGTLINVTNGGDAAIAGAVLEVELGAGYNLGYNDTFILINAGWDGFFKDGEGNDLLDGAIVWGDAAGDHVVLNYVEGNDSITLTAIPEPGSLALVVLAGSLLAAVRRRG